MLLHFPRHIRPAIAALWKIDEAMGEAVASATQPMLAAIKLAWWRDALDRLDHAPPPPEPRLRAAAEQLLSRGISGHQLSALEAGWAALLDEQPDAVAVASRGRVLFAIEAQLLETEDPRLADAGSLFALTEAARRGHELGPARDATIAALAAHRVRRTARPITLAARLAARDPCEPEGTPARAFALLAHRLTGIVASAH